MCSRDVSQIMLPVPSERWSDKNILGHSVTGPVHRRVAVLFTLLSGVHLVGTFHTCTDVFHGLLSHRGRKKVRGAQSSTQEPTSTPSYDGIYITQNLVEPCTLQDVSFQQTSRHSCIVLHFLNITAVIFLITIIETRRI